MCGWERQCVHRVAQRASARLAGQPTRGRCARFPAAFRATNGRSGGVRTPPRRHNTAARRAARSRGRRSPGQSDRGVAQRRPRGSAETGEALAMGGSRGHRMGDGVRDVRQSELTVATQLKPWVGAALAACVLVALLYLPPRGGVTAPESRFGARNPQVTAARLHQQAIAEMWRSASAEVRLVRATQQLAGSTTRPRDTSSLTLIVDGPDSTAVLLRSLVAP